MKILTADQMRRIDERTEREFGIPATTLMDNAGREVARTLLKLFPAIGSTPPVIVCGKGNNGGDGVAAARHLRAAGITARVILLAPRAAFAGAAGHHLELAAEAGVSFDEASDDAAWDRLAPLAGAGVVVDAILGTGLSGPARGLALRAIAAINAASAPVVSVDIPSGLAGDSAEIVGLAVRADHTLALACPKWPHVFDPASALVGQLHVLDIGIPLEAIQEEQVALNLLTEAEVGSILPPREAASHKGDFGRLLVVAGSRGKSGAAALVCRAALRSGAGLVTAATPAAAQPIVAGHLMEAMTEALAETREGALSRESPAEVRRLAEACDVMAIGPGLTATEETAAAVRAIVAESEVPVVLDADGLNAFAGRASELSGESRPLILTPHPGEMARLLGAPDSPAVTPAQVQRDRLELARGFSRAHACHLVLKGRRTIIADPDGEAWINLTGNPGMATGGTGDALTGVIAGLLAQGLSALEACALGVYVHGLAGDLAAADLGETSLIAGDVIDYLAEAFQHLEDAAG